MDGDGVSVWVAEGNSAPEGSISRRGDDRDPGGRQGVVQTLSVGGVQPQCDAGSGVRLDDVEVKTRYRLSNGEGCRGSREDDDGWPAPDGAPDLARCAAALGDTSGALAR